LDQFPHALDVIVGCARKTEVALWEHLFSIVGNPQDLFEVGANLSNENNSHQILNIGLGGVDLEKQLCLREDRLKTATSYLIIIQTLEPLSVASHDTVLLLQSAIDAGNYEVQNCLLFTPPSKPNCIAILTNINLDSTLIFFRLFD
jgi:hypothetical protein